MANFRKLYNVVLFWECLLLISINPVLLILTSFFILLTVHNVLFCFIIANDLPLTEWEYLPPVGPRPPRGFVGLKNAGATCYMNSVLQQLYMIEDIRNGILSVEGAATDPNEDFSGEERVDNEVKLEFYHERFSSLA